MVRGEEMNRFIFRFFVVVGFCTAVFSLSGCGGGGDIPQQNKSLDLVFLDVNSEVPIESIKNVANEFSATHDDLIVNTTTVVVEPDVSFQELLRNIRNVDAIFFPSLLEETIEKHSNIFYPLILTETNLPEDILSHYKIDEGEGIWSVPVYIDPVVMLVRKKAMTVTGDQKFPENWAKLLLVSQLGHTDLLVSYPNMVIYNSSPYAITDSVAAFYLSRGLFYDQIFGEGLSPTMEEVQHEIQQNQILMSIARFQSKNPEEMEYSFVKRKSLKEYADSIALFTYARLSELKKEPDEIKQQVYTGVLPNPFDKNPVLCYSVNTSVSLESDEPELANGFIQYLLRETVENDTVNFLTLKEWQSTNILPENRIMVTRRNAKTVHEKYLFERLQGKKKTLDYKDVLMQSYKIIE